jgi:peroxiredoxin
MVDITMEQDLEILEEMVTHAGSTLLALTYGGPVLLVFLRHFGCVFCKEALDDLAQKRTEFENSGIRLVFVHMSDKDTALSYFEKFNLNGIDHISDPEQRYYASFGLHRGTFSQLYGLHTWMRGFQVKASRGYQVELAHKLGDSTQMPGVFVLHEGQIKESFIHQYAAERPNYDRLVSCCIR